MTNNKLFSPLNCRFALTMTLILCLGLTLNAQTYCPSKGNLPWTEWIAGVKFGTINSTSSKEGYGDFTSQTTNLAQGTSYPLSITQGFSYAPDAANATQQGKAWIDFNKNGTFEATELVASFTRTTVTANVVIPTTASTGATRMRVSFKTIGAPTACEVFDKGEVEDYTVNIQSGTVQSCANNALDFDSSNDLLITSRTVIPANADFTLEASCLSTATTTGCSGAFRRLLVFDLGSSLNRFEIGDCAGQLTTFINIPGNTADLTNIPNTNTLRNGNWHHVSAVKQGTNLTIYYDGVAVLTRANMSGLNPVARQLVIGNWVEAIEGWKGSIDEVKVWNYAMTAAEVQAKRLCTPTGLEPSLLLYYPFNQGVSSGDNATITTVVDKSTQANNGQLRNFALTGSTSNFVCSNLALTACNTAVALPDLVPDYFRISGYTVDRTTTISEVAVTNRGSASFPITNLHVFISRDSVYPSGRLFLDLSVTGIAAGGTYQSSGQRLLLDTFQAGVKYYTIAVIDPNNAVAESNESNNVWISKGVIYKNVVVNNSCRYQDSLQLVSLYNAAGGANWINKWNLSTPINTWYGVTLNVDGCVTQLELPNNNLVGSIPNLNMTNLDRLYLYSNSLSGGFPILVMPNLTDLNLATNQLSGALPNINLPKITKFIVFSCQLSGTIPNFANSPNLRELVLSTNKLTGTIPNFSLLNLESLILGENLLSGAVPNFNTPKIIYIILEKNQLTSVPLFNYPLLSVLAIGSNKLNSTIPNFSATNLPSLTLLSLENNNLSGCLPNSLKSFCGKTVNLYENPNLATQDFAAFCANVTGFCTTNTSDLALSITSTPSVYRIYTTHNFKISVANNGTTAFTNVKIKFIRPALTVSGGTKTASIGTFNDYCPGGIECSEWTIPSLAAGEMATLDAPIFILAPTGGITATATLLSSFPTDTNTANNSASITINPATAAQAPTSQALAFQVPTQLIPVIVQRIAPNPTEGEVIVKLDSWKEQTVDFNFSDITGKTIHSEKRALEKGVNRVAFDLYALPQGVYFIQTNVGKGTNVPTKFVKM